MNKKQLITAIKNIIQNHGSFSIADIEAESSPVIASIGKDVHQLAESFNFDGVKAVTYVHETETSEELIAYENLKKDILDEILTLAWDFEELSEKAHN